jgi:hypothetical protein
MYFICESFVVDSVFVSKSVPSEFVVPKPATHVIANMMTEEKTDKKRKLFYAVDKTLLTRELNLRQPLIWQHVSTSDPTKVSLL